MCVCIWWVPELFVSSSVGAGNQTLVLWESGLCSELLNRLPGPQSSSFWVTLNTEVCPLYFSFKNLNLFIPEFYLVSAINDF